MDRYDELKTLIKTNAGELILINEPARSELDTYIVSLEIELAKLELKHDAEYLLDCGE